MSPATVVTISASYGAGGSVVGPAVAERLGVPFADRAIPAAVAEAMLVPLKEAMSRDEQPPTMMQRILAAMAASSMDDTGFADLAGSRDPTQAYEAETRKAIRELASTGAVILGRGAAFVLAGHPSAVHVRLDGPVEARLARAMEAPGMDAATTRRQLESNDRARLAYVRHFHRADPADCRHYHLTIESTRFDLDTCVEMVVAAAAGGRSQPR